MPPQHTVPCTLLDCAAMRSWLYCQVNAKISKTTHLKEMNFEIEKLKQMLIATREKNGEREGVLQGACLPGLGLVPWLCLPAYLLAWRSMHQTHRGYLPVGNLARCRLSCHTCWPPWLPACLPAVPIRARSHA